MWKSWFLPSVRIRSGGDGLHPPGESLDVQLGGLLDRAVEARLAQDLGVAEPGQDVAPPEVERRLARPFGEAIAVPRDGGVAVRPGPHLGRLELEAVWERPGSLQVLVDPHGGRRRSRSPDA